jgi:ketosteroid isomerase-like protein
MDKRAVIDAILDEAYAARRAHDADAAAALFASDGHFAANGAAPVFDHADRVSALRAVFEAFEIVEFHQHCRVIDPPRAVVHWHGTFRASNGRVGAADVLDLIEVRDGKIAALTTFFDTAYAAALGAAN